MCKKERERVQMVEKEERVGENTKMSRTCGSFLSRDSTRAYSGQPNSYPLSQNKGKCGKYKLY